MSQKNKIHPLSLGLKKINKNTFNYPICEIIKKNDNQFELNFTPIDLNIIDIKVNIIPINCDHNILWMIEASSKENTHTYGTISYVDKNTGLWLIETLNSNNLSFFGLSSDINNKLSNNLIAKRSFSFTLQGSKDLSTNVLKILAKKI